MSSRRKDHDRRTEPGQRAGSRRGGSSHFGKVAIESPFVMVREGPPSTSLSEPASRFVDGGTSLAMTVTGQTIRPLVLPAGIALAGMPHVNEK